MHVTNEEVRYSFTAENNSLVKTVNKNIDLLDNYGKYLSKFASESLAATNKEIEQMGAQIKSVTSVATQMNKVFSDFQRQLDKFSTGFNWTDEAIRKQEKLTKSARESAKAFEDAIKTQNKNNAGSRGAVNVDAPSKSASASAEVFQQFFADESTKLGGLFSKLSKYGTEFANLKGVISSSASSAAAFGAKLHVVFAVLNSIFQVAKKLAPVVLQITKTVSKFVTTPLRLLYKGFDSLKQNVGGSTNALKSFGSVLGFGAGASVGTLLSEATKNASDMAEAINLFNVVMKDGREEGNRWLYTLSEMSGMDATNLMSITGLFYEMGAAVEMPHEAATKLSQDLTELSMDISSLFNVDLETVTQNMTSGIRGMSRAVVKYGMDLRATTVEAFARSEYNITEQYETMNETNRILLRYLVMLSQARDANNDFAATIEAPANQLRVFKQQVLGLSREFGRFIVHVLKPALPVLNGIAMALRNITKFLADMFNVWSGIDSKERSNNLENTSDGIDSVGDAAGSTAKKLNQLLAPFDELNILAQETANGGGGSGLFDYGVADPRLLDALKRASTGFDEVKMKAHKARDAVLEFFGFEYVFDPKNGIDEYLRLIPGQFADNLINAFRSQNFEQVGQIIAEKLNPVIKNIADSFSWSKTGPSIRRNLGALIDSINGFMRSLQWTTVGETFGNLLKTTFETIAFSAIKFDWNALGSALANSLNGFFGAFSFESVALTLSSVLKAITEFAASFTKEFNWTEFGTNLSDSINAFFTSWDATNMGKAANEIITKLVTMMKHAIETTNWKLVADKIAEFLEALDWGEILKLLGSTIWAALKASVMAALEFTIGRHGDGIAKAVDKAQAPITGATGFAVGGVVTGPTRALIGEAGRDEMVMPLDNSPQMLDFIDKIADRVSGGGETVVKVYIGDREWDAFTYESAQRGQKLVGAQPIREGRA